MAFRPSGHVALLTDFGLQDPFVGLMQGMVLREAPKAVVVDLCHGVPAQQVALGGLMWRQAIDRFPPGTVHVGVVDPGVGTARRIVAAQAHGCVWVAPDNGLLLPVLQGAGQVRVRAVDVAAQRLPTPSKTFHGRDLFAPIAGRLAVGRVGFDALGATAGELVEVPDLAAGEPRVVWVDHFGNLITNVAGDRPLVGLEIGGQQAPAVATYGAAASGDLIALVNSFGLWEVAMVGGSAADRLAAGVDTPVGLGP